MGSVIEINDTLKISKERGFPKMLTLENHTANPESSSQFLGRSFHFWNSGARLYHQAPTRVFLVEELPDSNWLYWGHAHILSQTIEGEITKGTYKIVKLYDPAYQKLVTIEESPSGKSCFISF